MKGYGQHQWTFGDSGASPRRRWIPGLGWMPDLEMLFFFLSVIPFHVISTCGQQQQQQRVSILHLAWYAKRRRPEGAARDKWAGEDDDMNEYKRDAFMKLHDHAISHRILKRCRCSLRNSGLRQRNSSFSPEGRVRVAEAEVNPNRQSRPGIRSV